MGAVRLPVAEREDLHIVRHAEQATLRSRQVIARRKQRSRKRLRVRTGQPAARPKGFDQVRDFGQAL